MPETPSSRRLDPAMQRAFTDHSRVRPGYRYMYAVVSRRSGGLSIGINLNPDKACNFDCVYCSVDRTAPAEQGEPNVPPVDLKRLQEELHRMLASVVHGDLWLEPRYADVAPAYRHVTDLAFSGDGEPTAYPRFEEAVKLAIDARDAFGLHEVRLVLITNATLLRRPNVQRALALLDQHGGEVWAKLDAGDEDYYRLVDRSKIPLAKVLANLAACGRQRPIVIQSLFAKLHGRGPTDAQFDAYLARLAELLDAGCRIRQVQLYTTARPPAEPWVSPLDESQLQQLAARLRQRLPQLPCAVYA